MGVCMYKLKCKPSDNNTGKYCQSVKKKKERKGRLSGNLTG